jgi:hypothetical protein
VLSDPDQETAGPWYFCGLMAARAYLLQDRWEQVDQIVDWSVAEGGSTHCWAERVAHMAPRDRDDRYVNVGMTWTWGEWLMLILQEGCGLRPEMDGLRLEPHVPPSWGAVRLEGVRWRDYVYDITYQGTGSCIREIRFEGQTLPRTTLPQQSGSVVVVLD